MAFQLVYTSAPELLEAGRTGFGTVAKHAAIKASLQTELERISQFSREVGLRKDRILFYHRVINLRDEQYHIISRIKDSGSDYTGRTNHIAHHIIISSTEVEKIDCTPVDVIIWLNNNDIWKERWDASPYIFGVHEEINLSQINQTISLPAKTWEYVIGDAGKAAVLGPGGKATEGCWIVYGENESTSLITLIGESLCLHSSPWNVSFASDTQPTDRIEEIQWRGVEIGSPLERAARQSVRPVIDLSSSLNLPDPVEEFVSKAKTGLNRLPPAAARSLGVATQTVDTASPKTATGKIAISNSVTGSNKSTSISALKSKAAKKEQIKKEKLSWLYYVIIGVLILLVLSAFGAYYEINLKLDERKALIEGLMVRIENTSQDVIPTSISKKYPTEHIEEVETEPIRSTVKSIILKNLTDKDQVLSVITGKDSYKAELQNILEDVTKYSNSESSTIGLDDISKKIHEAVKELDDRITKKIDDRIRLAAEHQASIEAQNRKKQLIEEQAAAKKQKEEEKKLESKPADVISNKISINTVLVKIDEEADMASVIQNDNPVNYLKSDNEKPYTNLASIQYLTNWIPYTKENYTTWKPQNNNTIKRSEIFTLADKNNNGTINVYIFYKDTQKEVVLEDGVFMAKNDSDELKLENSKILNDFIKSIKGKIIYSISVNDKTVYTGPSLEALQEDISKKKNDLNADLNKLVDSTESKKTYSLPSDNKDVKSTKEILYNINKTLFEGLPQGQPTKIQEHHPKSFNEWLVSSKDKNLPLQQQYKKYLFETLKLVENYLYERNSYNYIFFVNLGAKGMLDDSIPDNKKVSLKESFDIIQKEISSYNLNIAPDKDKANNDTNYYNKLKTVFTPSVVNLINDVFYTPPPAPIDPKIEIRRRMGEIEDFIRELKKPFSSIITRKIEIKNGSDSVFIFTSK